MVYRKRRPLGIVPKYSPRGLTFSDGPRMTPYHEKLLEDAELLTNLDKCLNATVELLSSVTC